jgi:hypothetical protein
MANNDHALQSDDLDSVGGSVPDNGAVTPPKKAGAVNTLTSIGHIIIGTVAIAATTTLAILHDVTGTTAIELIVAVAGVSLGIGAATNSVPASSVTSTLN